MNLLKIKNTVSVVGALAIAFGGFVAFSANSNRVNAAAVAVTASPIEFAATTATDVTVSFTSGAEYAIGETIVLDVVSSSAATLGGALTDCGTATTTVGGGAGSFGFSSGTATYTFSAASTTATTTASLCIRFPATTAQGSYSISLTDSVGNFGAELVYVGNDNDVFVSAIVRPTLSFNIRNITDTADTNVCAMGAVDTSSLPTADATVTAGEGECGYSLAIATNAANGFQATIQADQVFQNGAADTIANVTNGAAFSAGTEAYGLAWVNPGTAAAGEGITENGNFSTNSTPVPLSATNFISGTGPVTYTAGTDATDVTEVVHGFAVSSATNTGLYSHTITYYVDATF
ncbi:MAG: hypothetical protein Q9M91_00360 [Candidatus Dojkabacteria bacterium]|nr:hypothetical protein [Candidatus Dojkabacteria bacterium]MDQ7020284.1 hypothetical protein [Candidatus Dojkabacteria bacterium]